MPKSLTNLKAEADALGIPYDSNATIVALQELIDKHQPEEKTPEQLQRESDDAAKILRTRQVITPEKKFSADDVQMMIQQAIRSVREQDANMDKPEEHSKELKTARLPRFQNKFIVALKDMNADEYSTDPIYTSDIWDERTRQNIPWVTLVFLDGSELLVPYKTAIEKSIKVDCEIAGVLTEDASYKTGQISKLDEDGQAKGEVVQGINKQTSYRWKLSLPNSSQIVEVGPEVINW